MEKWNNLASDKSIKTTINALEKNGIKAIIVNTGKEARKKALELIPKGAEVMTMASVTLDTIGLSQEIDESGNYNSVRVKLLKMDRKTQRQEMNRLGATPEFAVGSVHAVTEDGHVLIASNTGSQLPAYSFGALHVIWVVGAQKIVKNTDEGIKRIYEYSLPLESERAKKAYGVPGSAVNKILIVSKEVQPGRVKLILVKEKLGF